MTSHTESDSVTTVELRPAKPHDREYVERLLTENDLPTSDLDSAYSSLFICESTEDEEESESVGVGGLEIEGAAGLLRSVAVEESVRGTGYGTAICEQLLDRAREIGLDSVFLLTTTAEEFFADRGFERVEREQVPDSIRETAEFSDICPSSATCMKKKIE